MSTNNASDPSSEAESFCCPGCKAQVPPELRKLATVPCQKCGKYELHTGVRAMAIQGPPGTPAREVNVHPPLWQARLPTAPVPKSDEANVGSGAGGGGDLDQQETNGEGLAAGGGAMSKGKAKKGARPDEAGPLDALAPSRKKAYSQYLWALNENASLEGGTDQEVYDFVRDHLLEEGEKLPTFASWGKYLREARAAVGAGKNSPRAGRNPGRSIIGLDEA
jgi:hypothetical protein